MGFENFSHQKVGLSTRYLTFGEWDPIGGFGNPTDLPPEYVPVTMLDLLAEYEKVEPQQSLELGVCNLGKMWPDSVVVLPPQIN